MPRCGSFLTVPSKLKRENLDRHFQKENPKRQPNHHRQPPGKTKDASFGRFFIQLNEIEPIFPDSDKAKPLATGQFGDIASIGEVFRPLVVACPALPAGFGYSGPRIRRLPATIRLTRVPGGPGSGGRLGHTLSAVIEIAGR